MDRILEICEKLKQERKGLYLYGIWRVKSIVELEISDKYGNEYWNSSVYFDINTLEQVAVEALTEYSIDGMEYIEVPQEYVTYRDKIIERLEREIFKGRKDIIGIPLLVKAIYDVEAIGGIELEQLYKVCRYMVVLFRNHCNAKERDYYQYMVRNKQIKKFLKLPMNKKVETAEEYFKVWGR